MAGMRRSVFLALLLFVVLMASGCKGQMLERIEQEIAKAEAASRVIKPVFSLAEGIYTAAQTVSISCSTPEARIRFTVDGSDPTSTTGSEYSAPITIAATTTLQAIAYLTGRPSSEVATAQYFITGTIATPVFDPAEGTYDVPQNISIRCISPGASIRFTTDGTDPTTTTGTEYSVPVSVPVTTTLKAIAYKPDWAASAVVTATFTIFRTVTAPTFDPPAGEYEQGPTVIINCATIGASVRYTLDGNLPTSSSGTLYTAPVVITSPATLKAIAYYEGWADSAVTSGEYSITGVVAAPTFTPSGGSYPASIDVSINCTTPSASIRYTTDGITDPSATFGTPYSGLPIRISSNSTLKAVAYRSGMLDSSISSAMYSFVPPSAPTISNAAGGIGQVSVTWGAVSGATSYNLYWAQGATVTTGTGTKVSNAVSPHTAGGLLDGTQYSFIVTAVGSYGESAASTVANANTYSQVATPQFNPGGGSNPTAQNVVISCSTTGAVIHYTTDGSTPSQAEDPSYSSPIPVSSNITLKAIAFKTGMIDSATASATYTFVPPGAPTISSAVAADWQVTVSWGAVSGATSYNLYWALGATVTTGTGTKISSAVSPRVLSGLTNGTQYAFIVTAVGSYGEGAASGVVTATTPPLRWITVGSAGFSAGQADYTSMAISSGGTPYVAYKDGTSTKATVRKYNGSSWVTVGSAGFSTGQVDYTSLAIDSSGIPYVAYQDSGYKATVMYFDGSNWQSSSTNFSSGQAIGLSLKIDSSGLPYVAYRDNGDAGGKATVMRYNGWMFVQLGASPSAGEVYDPCLAIDSSGTPYIAYTDMYYGVASATVMKYNVSSWVAVGSTAFSAKEAYTMSLAIGSGGTPFVAYRDGYNSSKATVMKYTGTGLTGWAPVGSVGFSAGTAYYTSLAIDLSGNPCVAYSDGANGGKATVMKHNGSSWVNMGTAGISVGAASYISLVVDANGTPYIAFKDAGNGGKATVMVYK